MWSVLLSVRFERQALQEPRSMMMMVALFAASAVAVRWGTKA